MFTANTKEQTDEMLKEIGVRSFEDLLESIPKELLNAKFDLPCALTEIELSNHVTEIASKNRSLLNFTGAGAYEHFIPAAVNALAGRGEFVTAYTPYQAEASQGTLQAVYEFQSSVCALLDTEVSNASMYDGATALAESINAAVRITSRNKVLISEGLHPHYKKTLETYFKNTTDIKLLEIKCPGGVIDAAEMEKSLDDTVACIVLPTPNFYGCIEDAGNISKRKLENPE